MVLKLNMNDSRSHQRRSIGILLDLNEAIQNELIPKLAVHDMIRRLEYDRENIVWMSKQDINETLVELSLKHGVLCKETAFFCETEKSNVKTLQETQRVKIVIPAPLPADYEMLDKRKKKKKTLSRYSRGANHSEFDKKFQIKTKAFDPACFSMKKQASTFEESTGKQKGYQEESEEESEEVMELMDIREDENTPSVAKSDSRNVVSKASPSGSYLQVVMKQKFEGFWDPQDSSIYQNICKNGALTEVPEQIKNIDASLAQTVWLTLLVLLWLEVACQNDRKAWLLIYQKGVNWLKKVGVNYEETKNLGTSFIN